MNINFTPPPSRRTHNLHEIAKALSAIIISGFMLFGCNNVTSPAAESTSPDETNNHNELVHIKINQYPGKLAYLMGEPIDLTGLQLVNMYDDGSSKETSNYTISGDTFTAGITSITVISQDDAAKTASFEINVSGTLVDTGLPVFYVATQDAQPVLSKEDYVKTDIKIVSDNPGYCVEKTGLKDEIRGRGNTTWNYPKKPYRIKFNKKTSLFGLPEAKSWVLLANYKDATLLSNTIAFELGKRFGLPYTNHYTHVELVLNGVYQGSYVLTEQVQVGTGRVDIDEDAGYLVELDVYYDEEPKFKTANLQLPVMIKSPEDLDDPAGYNFVKDSLNALDSALSSGDFPDNDYTGLIDIDNLVDFIMINEIAMNGELGHPKSTYLYKDRGQKIRMGPLWDFDWALGLEGNTTINLSTAPGRMTGGWFFSRFFNDPLFVSKYKARWNEKYADVESILTFIDTMYDTLKTSQSLNSSRWYQVDYEGEIHTLKTWWSNRVQYLNMAINNGLVP